MKNFLFDYEQPNRRSILRTPIRISMNKPKNGRAATSGRIYISPKWATTNSVDCSEISLQVKGAENSFIIFSPPSNAPRFKKCGYYKQAHLFSATNAARNLLSYFSHDNSFSVELTLDYVGLFADKSKVYRIRRLNETDKLYDF